MMILSVETTAKTIKPLLKHDEKIVCENAIVAVDSKGVISWWDKGKMINIIYDDKAGN